MNDNTSFERFVAEAFDREGPGRPVPDAIHDDLISRAGRQRQRPTWLAFLKEPPMRLSNSNAVGSPTVRVVATMLATLLLIAAMAVAGVAGKNLLAADGTIIVDPEGRGNFGTIAEAIAAAEDGDTVLIKNGTYRESVMVDKDISLVGESRDGVILEFGAGCTLSGEGFEIEQTCPPEVPLLDRVTFLPPGPFALHLLDSNATVSDLSFRHLSNGYGLYVNGGAPSISGVTFADNTRENTVGDAWVMLRGGTSATVADSDLGIAPIEIEEASPATIENNIVGALLSNAPWDEPIVLRGNTVSGIIWADGMHVIEDNVIDLVNDEFESAGILITSGVGWTVKGNTVKNSTNPTGAIDIGPPAGVGEIIGNTVEDSFLGISLSNDTRIEGNTVRDGDIGIRVSGSSSEVLGNTVEGMSRTGFEIGLGGSPTLRDNVGCGSTTDLLVAQRTDAVIDESNEFCVVNDMRTE